MNKNIYLPREFLSKDDIIELKEEFNHITKTIDGDYIVNIDDLKTKTFEEWLLPWVDQGYTIVWNKDIGMYEFIDITNK